MAQLAEISNIQSESGRGASALALLLSEAPFISYLDSVGAFELGATKFNYDIINSTSTAPARAIGSGNYEVDREDDKLFNPVNVVQAAHGDSVGVDVSYQVDGERNLGNMMDNHQELIATRISSFGKAMDGILFNGNPSASPAQIKGLIKILNGTDNIPGFSVTGVYDAKNVADSGENHLDVSTSDGQKRFLEMMNVQLLYVPNATGIIMNVNLWARCNTMARDMRLFNTVTDDAGRTWDTFNGKKIVPVENHVISLSEPNGASSPANISTSAWIMAPAERKLSFVTNSGLEYNDFKRIAEGQYTVEKFEMRGNWKIKDSKAIRRIKNIVLAT